MPMHEARRLAARVAADPDDLEAVVALCRQAARTGWVPDAFREPKVRGALGRAWQAQPREPALWEFVLPWMGLELPRVPPDPGRGWRAAGRLGGDPTLWYDRTTGLPLAFRRRLDGAVMLLVPGAGAEGPALLDRFPVTRRQAARRLRRAARVLRRLGAGREELPLEGLGRGELKGAAVAVGARLPTPEQWRRAARDPGGGPFPWGDAPPTPAHATLAAPGLRPVDATPAGAGPWGHRDLVGNVAELLEAPEALVAGGRYDTPVDGARDAPVTTWSFGGEPVGRGVGIRGCLDIEALVRELGEGEG